MLIKIKNCNLEEKQKTELQSKFFLRLKPLFRKDKFKIFKELYSSLEKSDESSEFLKQFLEYSKLEDEEFGSLLKNFGSDIKESDKIQLVEALIYSRSKRIHDYFSSENFCERKLMALYENTVRKIKILFPIDMNSPNNENLQNKFIKKFNIKLYSVSNISSRFLSLFSPKREMLSFFSMNIDCHEYMASSKGQVTNEIEKQKTFTIAGKKIKELDNAISKLSETNEFSVFSKDDPHLSEKIMKRAQHLASIMNHEVTFFQKISVQKDLCSLRLNNETHTFDFSKEEEVKELDFLNIRYILSRIEPKLEYENIISFFEKNSFLLLL